MTKKAKDFRRIQVWISAGKESAAVPIRMYDLKVGRKQKVRHFELDYMVKGCLPREKQRSDGTSPCSH